MLLLLQSCILLKSTDFELNNQETGLVSDCSNPTETVVSSVIDIAMGCPLLSTEDPNGLYNHFESYQLELPDEICTLEIEFNSSNSVSKIEHNMPSSSKECGVPCHLRVPSLIAIILFEL